MTDLPNRSPDSDDKLVKLFACSCGAERATLWDAITGEVVDEVCGSPARLTSAIVFGLESHFTASIVGIVSDQWARILVTTQDGFFRTEVDCDLVEHGLAATWRLFQKRFPDGYAPPEPGAEEHP